MISYRGAIAVAVWAGCVGIQHETQAGPSRETAQTVANSVVSITAGRCSSGPDRAGTGFLFQDPRQVVTANHVVAGCTDISLWFERVPGRPTMRANLARVLLRDDLALLSIPQAVSAQALRSARTVNLNDSLLAIGYPVDSPTMTDQDVSFSIGNSTLRQMLPTENQQELAGGTLDLDAQIYRFKSALYPGMSGGPIFDASGDVVAVVAGGLKSGAVAASWGWPANLMPALLSSNDPLNQAINVSKTYYTYSRASSAAERRRCGNLDFVRIATRSFGSMSRTADNPDRLQYTATISTRPIDEINAIQFDIWTHMQSGATVAVPAGIVLEAASGACLAKSPTGPFMQLIWGTPADDSQVIAAAAQFEQQFMAPMAVPNYGYNIDPALTLPGGQWRADGFLVNRKAFTIAKSPPAPQFQAIHQFETIMHRGGTFVGVGTINSNFMRCLQPNGVYGLCTFDQNYLSEWTRFILGTQLATYPVY
jgi:S1-C subfamily serine protease